MERVAQDWVKWRCLLAEGRQRCMADWFARKHRDHETRFMKRTTESAEQRLANQQGCDDVQPVKKLKVSDMVGAATQFDSVDKVMRAGVHIVSRRGKKERRVTRTVQKRVESRTGRIVSRLLHPDTFADWLDGFAGMQSRTPKSVFMVPTAKEREDLMSMF